MGASDPTAATEKNNLVKPGFCIDLPQQGAEGSGEGRQPLLRASNRSAIAGFGFYPVFFFFLFYRTSPAEGSFFSERFTFFKFQSIVFLNPLRITILGAQVASAKGILCHKAAITIRA